PTLHTQHTFPTRRSSDLKCPIPTANVKVTIPSRIIDPMRSVTGETLRLVKVAITNGSKNTPSNANKSQLGPILTFSGRSAYSTRSEEHTSELQSPDHLVC